MNLVDEIIPSLYIGFDALLIILFILYSLFALILIKQVKLMTDTLEVGLEKLLILFSYVHFIFAVGILFLAIIVLFV